MHRVTLCLPKPVSCFVTYLCNSFRDSGSLPWDLGSDTQNADFRRKPQIFADSPLLLEIPAYGGRRKPQETTDFRRKPKIFAGNRRKPLIGLRHLRSVTFSSALKTLSARKFRTAKALSSFLNTLRMFEATIQNE